MDIKDTATGISILLDDINAKTKEIYRLKSINKELREALITATTILSRGIFVEMNRFEFEEAETKAKSALQRAKRKE